MAKGFTVKAAVPKQKKKENTFDIAECRQLVRGKTIVFCLPGRGVSYQFLKSFHDYVSLVMVYTDFHFPIVKFIFIYPLQTLDDL